MDWNLILRCVEILAFIIVGLIFKLQIKSQGDLIEKMKTYSDIIDIKKLKDYSITLEELVTNKVKLATSKIVLDELMSKDYEDALSEISKNEIFDELFAFAYQVDSNLSEEHREELFKTHFPKFGRSLSHVIQKHNNPS